MFKPQQPHPRQDRGLGHEAVSGSVFSKSATLRSSFSLCKVGVTVLPLSHGCEAQSGPDPTAWHGANT